MKRALALLVYTTLATSAWAETDRHEPVAGAQDPRIRTFAFDPTNTMRLTSTGLSPVRLIFAPGEMPITVAGALVVNDPAKATHWFAASSQNTVVFQPLRPDMQVSFVFITTAIEGKARNYTIELRTRAGDIAKLDDPAAYIQVSFTYPKEPDLAAKAAATARTAAQAQAINTRITQARYNAPRNWHYSKRGAGCDTLTPAGRNWLSDDGHQTTLLFPGHMKPAVINTTDDQGEPKLITPTPIAHKVGTLYVLPATYPTFEVRRGTLVCELRNDRYDPVGWVTGGGSGTISPDVILQVKR